jgi:hypothetical protein
MSIDVNDGYDQLQETSVDELRMSGREVSVGCQSVVCQFVGQST